MDHQEFDEALEAAAVTSIAYLARIVSGVPPAANSDTAQRSLDTAKFLLQLHIAHCRHAYVEEEEDHA